MLEMVTVLPVVFSLVRSVDYTNFHHLLYQMAIIKMPMWTWFVTELGFYISMQHCLSMTQVLKLLSHTVPRDNGFGYDIHKETLIQKNFLVDTVLSLVI